MKKVIIIGIATLICAAAGFGYYYYVGCSNGTCKIVSSPYLSTIFGALIGASAGLSIADRKDKNADL